MGLIRIANEMQIHGQSAKIGQQLPLRNAKQIQDVARLPRRSLRAKAVSISYKFRLISNPRYVYFISVYCKCNSKLFLLNFQHKGLQKLVQEDPFPLQNILIKLLQQNLTQGQTIYMLSDIISVNSNAAINPQQRDERVETYQIVRAESSQYRVLAREFRNKSAMVSFWCVFWIICTLVVTAVLIANLQNLNINFVFFSLILSAAILTIFALYSRKQLQKIMAFSIINFSVIMAAISILFILSQKHLTVATSVLIFNQVVLSAIYIKHKGKMVLQMILLVELELIALKADDFVRISWAQVLIPLIPFFMFLTAAFVFILIYTLLLRIYYRETFKAKKISLLFLVSNLGCFSILISIPLSGIFFNLNLTVLCIFAIGFTSTNCICLWIYNSNITLHFCVHKQQVLEGDKEIKIELLPVTKPSKKKPLYRLSENWFGNQSKDSTFAGLTQYPECLVCTERQSDIVWMPCGHLSLCAPCCKDVIENKMISCILCKQKPTHICKIKLKDESQIKLDRQMGLVPQSSKAQAQTVIEQFQVRIS